MNVLIAFNPKGFADDAVAILKKAGHKVTTLPESSNVPQDELFKASKGKHAVLTLLSSKIAAPFFDAAGPQLKIVANYAVGFDNIDVKEATKRNIVVTNTPSDMVNEAVAEHTFALIMTLSRRIAEAHIFTTHGKYEGWKPDLFLGASLNGKTIGLIGAGRIATSVAERAAKGFGMKVLYSDLNKNEYIEKNFKAKKVQMDALLKQSDFVSLHVPLFPSTHHLISTKQFNMMKKTAYLINTARGPVVDEKAMLVALKSKKIAGVGIDVFECEPAIDCDLTDDLELRSFTNAVLTPHIASATFEARADMAKIAAKNIVAVLAGKKPMTPAK